MTAGCSLLLAGGAVHPPHAHLPAFPPDPRRTARSNIHWVNGKGAHAALLEVRRRHARRSRGARAAHAGMRAC